MGKTMIKDSALESNRVSDFRYKSTKRFFSTISGYVDGLLFSDGEGYNEKAHLRYNQAATNQLLTQLKRLGLEYQKVTGIWYGEVEKSFLVWNTAYTYEQFESIMLKLAKDFRQWGICIGKWIDGKYSIKNFTTDSIVDRSQIHYNQVGEFSAVSVPEALKDFGTVLTRHIYNQKGEIEPEKTKQALKFEAVEANLSLASYEGLSGAYERAHLMDEFFNTDSGVQLGVAGGKDD